MAKKSKLDSTISKITLSVFGIFIFFLIVFVICSVIFLAPVDKKNNSIHEFVVGSGWSKNKIADELKKDGLIKNANFFKVYIKFNNNKELYAGTYNLSKSMSVNEIIDTLNSGNSLENESITVTFIEGKRLTDYASVIAKNFGYDETEVVDKLNDETFIKKEISTYWFLTNDILKTGIYYPLEGYLFPDTYIFKKNATIEEILDKMIKNMGDKLTIYKNEISVSNYNIHELITLASIVELEGVNSADRADVAGVFYNRLKANMSLGSDVTTYYAVKKTFADDLSNNDLNSCNGYNTRGTCVSGLPIGPIASPSLSSITAVIEPSTNDYYYFVADKNKKTYFSKTLAEHNAIVDKLKSNGLWYQY